MAEYISSFTTGFADVIPSMLSRLLPGVRVLHVYDGLVNYLFSGRENQLEKVLIFNNSFQVIRKYRGSGCELTRMIHDVLSADCFSGTEKGTFRIRYSVNGQFVAVNPRYTSQLEEKICRKTKSRVDRISPQTEYWFLQRSEKTGFFCRLIGKRKSTEKNLHRGELRPEFAYIMCALGITGGRSVVLDPFGGYGSIPEQLRRHFPCLRILVSDCDPDRVNDLRKRFRDVPGVEVARRDALNMTDISGETMDVIITDPPWGFYKQLENTGEFYQKMLEELERVLRPDGSVVLLSARKEEFESAVCGTALYIRKRYDTLVNGKKATVYVLKKRNREKDERRQGRFLSEGTDQTFIKGDHQGD